MIENKLKDLVNESTAFGIPNLFRRKRILNKIFWFMFVILGTAASIVFTIQVSNDYFEYETITKTEYKYQQPLKFPTITISSDIEGGFFDRKKINNLINKCEIMHDSKSCTKNLENYFELVNYKDVGDCFRFNGGKNMKNESIPFLYSTIGGRDDYFEIEFHKNIGLRLFIHEVDIPPKIENGNQHESMILLSSNSRSYIVLDKIIENKLGLPYNNCYKVISDFKFNKTIIKYIQSLNQRYTQVNCLKLCFELDYIEKNPCNCSINTTLGNVWSDCFVGFDQRNKERCTMKYKTNFSKDSVVEKCAQYCPLECDSTFYTYSLSSGELTPGVTNTTTFRVFYNSLKVAVISQKPKTQLFDLVSNIGGIFGLFIGLSFVSLFEISEIFIEILIYSVEKSVVCKRAGAEQKNNKIRTRK